MILGNVISISSNINRTLSNYIDEYTQECIIIHLIRYLFGEMMEGANSYEIGDIELDEIYEDIICYRDDIISGLINFSSGAFENLLLNKDDEYEFSMAIYKVLQKTNKNMIHGTAYSDNIDIMESINGSFAFILDIAKSLLDGGCPKDDLKLLLHNLINQRMYNINKFIDKYSKEEK